eukprot:4386739-Pyramimonas_sp.AAC.2
MLKHVPAAACEELETFGGALASRHIVPVGNAYEKPWEFTPMRELHLKPKREVRFATTEIR